MSSSLTTSIIPTRPPLAGAEHRAVSTPSLQDGHHGARDARLLEVYATLGQPGIGQRWKHAAQVRVQATSRTKDLLHRAGFLRTRTHAWYAVPVELDRFDRLQIRGQMESEVAA